MNGKVVGYYSLKGKELVPHYEDGKVIDNQALCEELLPRQSGYYFGGTDYDQSYLRDIVRTFKICGTLLNDIDPEKHALYYYASW